jgi:hypothetical protein
MRGGTASNRDSGATDSALPTSRPGPQPQQSANLASFPAGGSGQQLGCRANPVGSTAGGSGMQRECEVPSPSTAGGDAGEVVSLRSIRKKKNTNKGTGNMIPHLQRFGLKIECRHIEVVGNSVCKLSLLFLQRARTKTSSCCCG